MVLPIALFLAMAAPQSCPAAGSAAALPSALRGWRDAATAPNIGRAFEVQGADPTTVRGLLPGDVAHGGTAALVPFEVDAAATYRVALSEGAWVDVVSGEAVLPSVAHRHGPACSGIHKIVDFRLPRGRYALHLSGMNAPSVRVLITRV
ncbi:MAG: hypothetical protein ACTHMG_05905 [Sphingomonas sp.]